MSRNFGKKKNEGGGVAYMRDQKILKIEMLIFPIATNLNINFKNVKILDII